MLASLIFMKHHVNAHCGWISPQPHSLCAATGEANTQCLTVEEAGLSWKNTPRTWIPIQNFFFRASVHGSQTSVLDFCQPVVTWAVLTFPWCAVPADSTALNEMLNIVRRQHGHTQREIVGIKNMYNLKIYTFKLPCLIKSLKKSWYQFSVSVFSVETGAVELMGGRIFKRGVVGCDSKVVT